VFDLSQKEEFKMVGNQCVAKQTGDDTPTMTMLSKEYLCDAVDITDSGQRPLDDG